LTLNQDRCQKLIARFPEAFVYCRADLNKAGLPEEYEIMEANESFRKIAGLSGENIIGRTLTAVLPGFKQTDPDWSSAFSQVATTANSACLEVFSGQDNRWFEITAFSDSTGYVAAIFRDITDRKLADQKITYYSFHDRLTGLFNRFYLEEEMRRLDTKRQLPISIIYADVNGLKLINDIFGHSIGDEMLLCAAEILTKSCREEDIIARWGGDEFVIMLPQTEIKKAVGICDRISDQCSTAGVRGIPFSIALGVAIKYNMAKSITEVLGNSEDKMYKNKLRQSLSFKEAFFNALFKILEVKGQETKEHIMRMQKIALKIGEKLNLPDPELNKLAKLVKLHDIGNVNISEEILLKKGPVTAKEWQVIKKHPETGCRIARANEEMTPVSEDILSHHERWDGTGYPRGLRKESIPLLARVATIADACEVMTRGRPYKRPVTAEAAVEEINKNAGCHFDPQLVNVFNSIVDEDASILEYAY